MTDTDFVSVAAILDLVEELNVLELDKNERKIQWLSQKVETLDLSSHVPIVDYFYFWDLIRNHHPVPEIGLLLGQKIIPSSKGVLASWVSQTSTLEEALDTFVNNISLMNTVEHWDINNDGKFCTLTITFNQTDNYPIMAVERSMSAIVAWAHLLSGKSFLLSEASFTFDAPRYIGIYHSIFGENLKFSSKKNTIKFPSKLLETPILTSSKLLKNIAEQQAKEVMESINKDSSIKGRVNVLVNNHLNKGELPAIETIARQVYMTRQTLYRKLKEEGTSYKEILDSVRSERVKNLLQAGEYNYTKICFELGFKNTSSFYKAFKRWFGVTPAKYKND